jgi:hypothetical protein
MPASVVAQLRLMHQTLLTASPEPRTLHVLLRELPMYLELLRQEQPEQQAHVDGLTQQVMNLQHKVAEGILSPQELIQQVVSVLAQALNGHPA